MRCTHAAFLGVVLLAGFGAAGQQLPHPDHIVVVIEENKGFTDVIGAARASYINKTLVASGALLRQSFGLHHPSQPNYLELFSGSEQGACNDDPPKAFSLTAANIAASLVHAHPKELAPFIGYAENLPEDLTTPGPTQDQYARKHCPWLDFKNVPQSLTKDAKDFPSDFTQLPRVAFVIPNLYNDMHSVNPSTNEAKSAIQKVSATQKTKGATQKTPQLPPETQIALEIAQGDLWLSKNLEAYRQWAMTHNSILIITWDEDSTKENGDTCKPPIDTPPGNRIPTIIIGEHVQHTTSDTQVTHHDLLRTILDMEGLAPFDGSTTAQPITGIWN